MEKVTCHLRREVRVRALAVHVNDLDVLKQRGAPAQRVEEHGRRRGGAVHEDLLT
jgi:hypothetical protein